jgi:hypothetical protein
MAKLSFDQQDSNFFLDIRYLQEICCILPIQFRLYNNTVHLLCEYVNQ